MSSRGVNKAIIVGTLGRDPEIKYTASGKPITNVNIATNEEWRDKNTGEIVKKTEWHRIVTFGKLAEIVSQYLKKGSQAYFEGKIETKKWQDQNGNDRYTTQIVAHEMQMLGGANQSAPSDQPVAATSAPAAAAKPPVDDGFDDIPF